jgi:cell fate (sporulation/competence/biofilm development) regulator YmcA (YheA/YmcA/DUF963 family)
MRNGVKTKENEFRNRENRIKKIVSMMKSYEDELFARDTKLIQKTGALSRAEEEIARLRDRLSTMNLRAKMELGEELEKASARVARKDHDAKIMRDMMES